ncbi:MAG: hypothetical protein RLY14_1463 [Planctomycetota bacterium]|jgi:hypothetical protein
MQKTFEKDTLGGVNKSVSRRGRNLLIFRTSAHGSTVSRTTVLFLDLKSKEMISKLV